MWVGVWRIVGVVAAVVLAGVAPPTYAQDEVATFERQLEQLRRQRAEAETQLAPSQRLSIDFGAYFSFDFLYNVDQAQNSHALREYVFTEYATIKLDNVHEFFFRGSHTYSDYASGDGFSGEDFEWEHKLERAYYQVDLQKWAEVYDGRTSDIGLVIKGGRQLVHWANGLAFSQDIDGGGITRPG